MTETINARVRQVFKTTGLSQAKFVSALGWSPSTFSLLLNGKREVQTPHIKSIASIYSVNGEWLLTGQGEMFSDGRKGDDVPQGDAGPDTLADYKELAAEWKDMAQRYSAMVENLEGQLKAALTPPEGAVSAPQAPGGAVVPPDSPRGRVLAMVALVPDDEIDVAFDHMAVALEGLHIPLPPGVRPTGMPGDSRTEAPPADKEAAGRQTTDRKKKILHP